MMKARTRALILVAFAIVAVVGTASAVSGEGADGWREALETRSEALNQHYGLGLRTSVAAGSDAASEPSWARALRVRSEALNRHYGLGVWRFNTSSEPLGDETAWHRALRIRSEALNEQYRLGEYAPRS